MQLGNLSHRARARQIKLGAMLVGLALALAAPGSASAAFTPAQAVLVQGAGMGTHPSPQVRQLQRALERHRFEVGRPGVDGRFGPLTAAAVRRLQRSHELRADGVVGPETRRLLSVLDRARRRASPTSQRRRSGASDRRAATASRPRALAATRPRGAGDGAQRSTRGRSPGNRIGWALLVAAAVVFGGFFLIVYRPRRVPAVAAAGETAPVVDGRVPEARNGAEGARELGTIDAPADARRPVANGSRPATAAPPRTQGSSPTAPERPPAAPAYDRRVLGYATVPAENGRERSQAHAAAIECACHRARLQLVELVRDRDNGHGLDRPGLAYALLQIANGRAGGLVVSNLKQLAASAAELGTLLEWFHNEQAALIALDLRLDTRRPEGRATAQALIQVGAWERERSRPSARAALSAGRAVARPARRPAVRDHPQLAERIAAMREANMTLQQIADRLNAESVPTLRGGTKWRPSSVPTAAGYKRPGSQPAAAAIAQER